jgi:hypothetical protein
MMTEHVNGEPLEPAEELETAPTPEQVMGTGWQQELSPEELGEGLEVGDAGPEDEQG